MTTTRPTCRQPTGSHWAAFAAAIVIAFMPPLAQAKRLALLVGVGQYPGLGASAQLAGPEHDVQAMRDVLVRKWDFNPADVKSLVNQQATKPAVLAALRDLQGRSAPGDELVVYLSGHGTSALNSSMAQLPVPHGSGAFVTSDFAFNAVDPTQGLLIGRTDLVPIFTALEQAGRKVWFITDSCYSAQQVRSVQFADNRELPSRHIPLPTGRERAELQADMALAGKAPSAPPYPYRNVLSLAASGEAEKARDIPANRLHSTPTLDGKPHGALTDALLRVLDGQIAGDLNGDGLLSLNEVHRATADFMAQRAYGHSPQRLPAVAEDQHGLGNAPVLGKRGVAMRPRQAAPEPLRLLDEQLPPGLRKALDGLPDVVWATNPNEKDLMLKAGNGRVVVRAASGDLLAGMADTDLPTLTAQVRQLAWAKRFRLLAEAHRRSALAIEIDPARNGNYTIGSEVAFVVRPEAAGTLVLLNISADGKVSVLYPNRPAEAQPLPAGQATFVPGQAPGQRIRVQEPVGMDYQFALVFDSPPPGLDKLYTAQNLSPDDSRLLALEAAIRAASGRFSFATSELRTLKP